MKTKDVWVSFVSTMLPSNIIRSVPRSRQLWFFDPVFGFHENMSAVTYIRPPEPIKFGGDTQLPPEKMFSIIFV